MSAPFHPLPGRVGPGQGLAKTLQQGASLIITLIMLGVIALTSAAVMRNASSSVQVSNNFRLQQLLLQDAEAALRFCEAQLLSAPAFRVSTLQEDALSVFNGAANTGWRDRRTWTGSGGASASLTTVPASYLQHGTAPSRIRPVCAVEKRLFSQARHAHVITARGFSADYVADSSGNTQAGSVVWLQSFVVLEDVPPAPRRVADRTWSRVLRPPFH